MADTDPVTWKELDSFCSEKQRNCHALHEERAKTHALEIEHERRKGYGELQTSIAGLTLEVGALKEMLTNKASWFLPRPVIYMLVAGGVGVGLAGRDLAHAILKWFGVGS
ncbi:hypothetical protein CCP3SC15_2410002 [Gammaproteobacteria bacterium]